MLLSCYHAGKGGMFEIIRIQYCSQKYTPPKGAERGKGAQVKDEGGFGRSTTHRDSKRNKEGFVEVNFDLLEVMRPRQCGL